MERLQRIKGGISASSYRIVLRVAGGKGKGEWSTATWGNEPSMERKNGKVLKAFGTATADGLADSSRRGAF
jgi:hypothetical protein